VLGSNFFPQKKYYLNMDLYIKLEVYKGGQKEESHAEHWQNCIICVCIIYIFVFILFFFFFWQ
jgi:hypothetical protein